MEFGWKIVVGSIVGFFGAALGSVGGVGGGGIFVPMLTLIVGFDPKSSTAISKCKYLFTFVFLYIFSSENRTNKCSISLGLGRNIPCRLCVFLSVKSN